jgi:hypothetical protein
MKLLGLIKLCLSESYSNVRTGGSVSNVFPTQNDLKQADALSPLELNGTYQLLVYADNVKVSDAKIP